MDSEELLRRKHASRGKSAAVSATMPSSMLGLSADVPGLAVSRGGRLLVLPSRQLERGTILLNPSPFLSPLKGSSQLDANTFVLCFFLVSA